MASGKNIHFTFPPPEIITMNERERRLKDPLTVSAVVELVYAEADSA